MIGIYCLDWGTNLKYIGQSTNIVSRWFDHSRKLRSNQHHNNLVQDTFNNLGEPKYYILEECSVEELDDKEKYWISKLDTYLNGFNKDTGGNCISSGLQNGNSKYSKETIKYALELLSDPGIPYKRVQELTSMSKSTVERLAWGTSHSWIKDEFRELVTEVELARSIRQQGKVARKDPVNLSNGVETFSVTNLSEFARKHNLDPSTLSKLVLGKRHTYRGWSILK